MKPVVYLLDTNILVRWATVFTSGFQKMSDKRLKQNCLRTKDFCEQNENMIVVPDIVWTEFLSVMLHRNIDVDDDYMGTRRRFHGQQSLVQQIEQRIRSGPGRLLNWVPPDVNPFHDAQELLYDPELIDMRTFEWMKRSAGKKRLKYNPGVTDRLTEKLLDGMDSAILIYLNELAHLDENKERLVVLYTADYPFCRISRRIISRHKNWFARNTTSACALFDKVFCMNRKCRANNDISILQKKGVVCKSCGGHLLK